METPLQLSVIIVNHRTEECLPECITAVTTSNNLPAAEIIIVDNPADLSGATRPAPTIPIRRISTPNNLGFAAACNFGAAKAEGPILMFLNPDVTVDADSIAHLSSALFSGQKIGLVGGRLRNPNGSFQPSCRRFPTIGRLLFSRGSVLGLFFGKDRSSYQLPDYDQTTIVDWTAAACVMMPKRIFDEVGGFDPSFRLYLEDTDLCYRLKQAGYQVLYVPAAGARHQWGASTRHYRFRRILWHHASVWRYFRKHHHAAATLVLLPLLAVNMGLSLTIEMVTLRR